MWCHQVQVVKLCTVDDCAYIGEETMCRFYLCSFGMVSKFLMVLIKGLISYFSNFLANSNVGQNQCLVFKASF